MISFSVFIDIPPLAEQIHEMKIELRRVLALPLILG